MDITRRRLFKPTVQHPTRATLPWLVSANFDPTVCQDCYRCAEHCPTQIIAFEDSGVPYLDFTIDGCELCEACIKICPQDAFVRTNQPAWSHRLRNSAACLAYQAVYCRSCQDACSNNAIHFDLTSLTTGLPVIDLDACSGCGLCIAACPSDSLLLT